MPEQIWLSNLWDAVYKRTKANFEHAVWHHPCKVICIAQSILYFLTVFSVFLLYCNFYHSPFVTLSTYFHILSLFTFSRVILFYLKMQIQICFLDLKMISERSKRRQKILSLVFILKCVSKKLLIQWFVFDNYNWL